MNITKTQDDLDYLEEALRACSDKVTKLLIKLQMDLLTNRLVCAIKNRGDTSDGPK